MKPRSQRLRDDAKCYGTFSLIFIFGAIFCGSLGYFLQGWEFMEASFALFIATILLVIASIAMLTDMFDAYRKAECEEYWEDKQFRDKFETSPRF